MKRSQPLRKRRKGPDAKLTGELDAVWRFRVKERAADGEHLCEVCNTRHLGVYQQNVLHAHHIVSRGRHALRWDLRNGVCLCYQHHFGLAHGDVVAQAKWRSWLNTYRSADFTYVLEHAEDDGKFTLSQKRDLLAELKEGSTC